MSESRVTFHRVEEYAFREHASQTQAIICSFDTERFGYLQVGFDEDGVYELPNEPDLNMLRERDRKYVENAVAITWRMVFETPAATGRFE